MSMLLGREVHWLPVLDVVHVLTGEEELAEEEAGCDIAYPESECLVVTSLALAVRAGAGTKEEGFKMVLPPTRWPLGGRGGEEDDLFRNFSGN